MRPCEHQPSLSETKLLPVVQGLTQVIRLIHHPASHLTYTVSIPDRAPLCKPTRTLAPTNRSLAEEVILFSFPTSNSFFQNYGHV
jgi:hypothetical protein